MRCSGGGRAVGGLPRACAGGQPAPGHRASSASIRLIDFAKPGVWHALPEFALDPGAIRSRSIDVVLLRRETREAILVEIWDWFDDVGAALRSLDGKQEALGSRLRNSDIAGDGPSTIRCLFIVRRTRRNERLLRELRPLFAARFSASSRKWIATLSDPHQPMPVADGLLWSTSNGALVASRLLT